MPKVDEAEYANGRELFESGASLRQLVEPIADDDGVFSEQRAAEEFSRVLGFADALLDKLRKEK